jgi:putative oxidoreductase
VTSFGNLMTVRQQWEWIGQLLARVAVGTLFFLSGRGKLFVPARRAEMRGTMRRAGLPRPEVSAAIVSAVEFSGGAMLLFGLLTPLACAMLIGVMTGAIVTTQIPAIKARAPLEWLGEFLYLPEVLYIIILVWLLLAGPGWLSVDGWLVGS